MFHKFSPQLCSVTLVAMLTLISFFFNIVDLQKVLYPLLVRRLWVEIILKALVVSDVAIQVLLPVVLYQIGENKLWSLPASL